MTAGQLHTPEPSAPTTLPYTVQRSSRRPSTLTSTTRGMRSPHLAVDMRDVNASRSSTTCESALISPCLIRIMPPEPHDSRTEKRAGSQSCPPFCFPCHSERSEESVPVRARILRLPPQNDGSVST